MKTILRQCASCKKTKDREELIKITKVEDNLVVNPDSKTLGRSLYVCKDKECIRILIKKKGIKRGLKFNNDNIIQNVENKLKEF